MEKPLEFKGLRQSQVGIALAALLHSSGAGYMQQSTGNRYRTVKAKLIDQGARPDLWAHCHLTKLLHRLVGPVFSNIGEALTYGYMGVNWSFLIPMLFGFGLAEPYLWKGQKTPGSWDDVE
ncbi:MAG: hypothetical protein J0H42_06795 [Rhizobiales bacterium]|nr:hypothetical protein [Hyphomicrobiales bacterium]